MKYKTSHNIGSLSSTDGMFAVVNNPDTPIDYAAEIGINLWRRGLNIQAHRIRIEKEEAKIKLRRKVYRTVKINSQINGW